MALARNTRKLMVWASQPPMPRLRRRTRPYRRKTSVLAAIPGTYGIWSELAHRLGCSLNAVQQSLYQEGWEGVLEAFQQERLRLGDQCLLNLIRLAKYSLNEPVRYQANCRLAEYVLPGFKPSSRVVVEGGDKPIQHQHQVLVFDVAQVLQLSAKDRLTVLEAAEARQREIERGGNGGS